MMHLVFFFFNDTATTEIYTLSLHDALPISPGSAAFLLSSSSSCCSIRSHRNVGPHYEDDLSLQPPEGVTQMLTGPFDRVLAQALRRSLAVPCLTVDPELFFAESPEDVETAKAMCAECPVR